MLRNCHLWSFHPFSPTICMIVNIVHGSVTWEFTASLSTNNGLSPLFLLSFPGAQRGMTLFPLLSPRILSSSRKTVGRNKGTATLLFFSPPYLLHTVNLTCESERLCCHWLIIHYLCLLDVCICSSVCLGDTVRNRGTGSFPANERTDLLLHEGWVIEERAQWRWEEIWCDFTWLSLYNSRRRVHNWLPTLFGIFPRKHVALIIHFVLWETRVDMSSPARGCDRSCATEVVAAVLCTRCRAEHILMIDLSKLWNTLCSCERVCVFCHPCMCARCPFIC